MYLDLVLHNKDQSVVFGAYRKLLLQRKTIHYTNLSRTLGIIVNEGPIAFCKVWVNVPSRTMAVQLSNSDRANTDSIIHKVRETLTYADPENYSVEAERASEGTLRDKKAYTSPAPAWAVLLHILN